MGTTALLAQHCAGTPEMTQCHQEKVTWYPVPLHMEEKSAAHCKKISTKEKVLMLK